MRDLDAARLLFGSGRMVDPVESLSDVMRVAQRLLADKRKDLCAWRAEIPEVLQFFREIFAQILRDLDARRALFRI